MMKADAPNRKTRLRSMVLKIRLSEMVRPIGVGSFFYLVRYRIQF